MSLERELSDLLNQTVRVNAFSSYDSYGAPTYATVATSHAARIEHKQHLVRGADGRDTVSDTIIYFGKSSTGGYPSLTAQSKLTLPDNTSPKIIAIERLRDESGVHHEVAHCGSLNVLR